MLLPGYWLAARKAAVRGLCRQSLWFLGSSSVSLGFLHRSDKLLDLLFQGLVPLLHILPGAFHVAEADFQGSWLLLLVLQFFTEPHHLSPHVIIFLLEATKKGRKEWNHKVWPLDSPSGLARRHPVRFRLHVTSPVSGRCLLVVSHPGEEDLPVKLSSQSMFPLLPEHVPAPLSSLSPILWHLVLFFLSFCVLYLPPHYKVFEWRYHL